MVAAIPNESNAASSEPKNISGDNFGKFKQLIKSSAIIVVFLILTVQTSLVGFFMLLKAPFDRQIRIGSGGTRSYIPDDDDDDDRSLPPAILGEYGINDYIQIKYVRLFYIKNGDSSKPLMLFLHGFPDFWFSWRYQIQHFAQNYNVVAVDLRGCGYSEKFYSKSEYKMEALVGDVKNLIDALAIDKKAIVIGHDIGALILYEFLLKHSEQVERYVAISAAPPYISEVNFTRAIYSWYIAFFQVPILPEFYLQSSDIRLGIFHEIYAHDTYEVETAYKFVLGKPGALRDPVNYYRANAGQFFSQILFSKRISNFKPNLPSGLIIYGADDRITPSSSYEFVKLVPNVKLIEIPNGGHYVHQQQYEAVNSHIDAFLSAF